MHVCLGRGHRTSTPRRPQCLLAKRNHDRYLSSTVSNPLGRSRDPSRARSDLRELRSFLLGIASKLNSRLLRATHEIPHKTTPCFGYQAEEKRKDVGTSSHLVQGISWLEIEAAHSVRSGMFIVRTRQELPHSVRSWLPPPPPRPPPPPNSCAASCSARGSARRARRSRGGSCRVFRRTA